jgi:hypothetical protein
MYEPSIEERLKDVKKPSIFTYLKIRLAIKLYKYGLIKGWDYAPLENKCYIQWR